MMNVYDFCWTIDRFDHCGLSMLDEILVELPTYLIQDGEVQFELVISFRNETTLAFESRLVLFCCVEDRFLREQERLELVQNAEDMVSWWSQGNGMNRGHPPPQYQYISPMDIKCSPTAQYVVGIKSFSLNLERRMAIRETWLSSGNICSFFLVGDLDVTRFSNSSSLMRGVKETLLQEHALYQDTLMGPQFQISDSYHNLLEKVLGFFHLIRRDENWQLMLPRLEHIVVCDDDVYVNSATLESYLRASSSDKFYAGEVLSVRLQHSLKPQRSLIHRNYLSITDFPLDVLPPFALGNFYVLSADLVDWIVENTASSVNSCQYHRAVSLQPVGDLEDVSIALWLLSAQVHPEHMPQLSSNLNEIPQDFISIANVKQANSFFQIHSTFGLDLKSASSQSTEFIILMSEASEYCTLFIASLFSKLLSQYNCNIRIGSVADRAMFSRVHVLVVSPNDGPVSSDSNWYSGKDEYFRSLFTSVSPSLLVMVSGEAMELTNIRLRNSMSSGLNQQLFDFIVVTTIDSHFLPSAPATIADVAKSFFCRSSLSECFFQLPVLYVPTISIALAELELVDPSFNAETMLELRDAVWISERMSEKKASKAVAYMYSKCNGGTLSSFPVFRTDSSGIEVGLREIRERFFSLIASKLPSESSHALGSCFGSIAPRSIGVVYEPQKNRYSPEYMQSAIALYREFKFVIAFENSDWPGYVSEKLLLPILAGSIPVYFGSSSVNEFFNPKSVIQCNTFPSLEDCADYIVALNSDDQKYQEILSEQPVSINSFHKLTEWQHLF